MIKTGLIGFLKRLFFTLLGPNLLEIYTDGSSKDGWGSWAYVICRNGKIVVEKSGRIQKGASNIMELQAAIEALLALPEKSQLTLFSDSRILIDAMKLGEVPAAFQAQINTLLSLSKKHKIQWQWVKAHRGNPFNERCDELCVLARST